MTTRPRNQSLLVRLQDPPLDAILRFAIGLGIVPLSERIVGEEPSVGALSLVLLGILFATRAIPAVLRKVVPFSQETVAAWAERRHIAKVYDSYQWQKLFWIGVGMGVQTLTVGPIGAPQLTVIAVCIVGGIAGQWIWRRRRSHIVTSGRAVHA